MIRYSQAIELILAAAAARRLGVERVALGEALGRVAMREVTSAEPLPAFTNSSMDGFALRAEWTACATVERPVELAVSALLVAGDRPGAQGESGAVEIMTGAPLPEGSDAVVRIEDVEVERDGSGNGMRLKVRAPLRPGENVRRRGTDFEAGQRVLSAGDRIDSGAVLACAALGVSRVEVRRRARVAVLSTGSELEDLSVPRLEPGRIRNATGPFLEAALGAAGVEVLNLGIVRDEPARFEELLVRAAREGADLVISTGAVSMGRHDFVTDSLARVGARILFHKAAIRPGKPICVAELAGGGPVFFGMPGNPISTAVALRFFVEPYLREILGMERERPIRARLGSEWSKPEGLRCLFRARIRAGAAGVEVMPVSDQASYVIRSLLEANGWVVLPEEGARLEAGTEVDAYRMDSWGKSWL